MMRLWAIFAILLLAGASWAVEPGERLADPELEARARALSKDLRCLVCRNESIDESHADLAKDLRLLVRERISAGDSDAEAIEFIVARYGEYVLLNPRATGSSVILWASGPVLLVLALIGAGLYVRRRRDVAQPDGLSEEEKARLSKLLSE